jgi:long-chain acyl-CoA synthetase
VLEFFAERGMPICEVWGMSETSCIVTTNRPGATKLGSVGQPLDGMELWIADDGELLVRGPLIMAGYRNRPDLTAAAIDADGWLHTGDIGTLDDDGFLTITDRKKDILVTAGGKNVAPQNLENDLKTSKYVSQAIVLGDRRPYVAALITIDETEVRRELGGTEPVHDSPATRELIQAAVDEVNRERSRYEQIKRFAILPRDFTIDADELTPTLKLKRRAVQLHFAAEIEKLYSA